jgi:hypothetical protein
MFDNLRHRIHPRGIFFNALERTFLQTSTMAITLVALLVLFVVIYFKLV